MTLEEKGEAMNETKSEVEMTKITSGICMRKRTGASTKMKASTGPASKKVKGKTPVSASLKSRYAYNSTLGRHKTGCMTLRENNHAEKNVSQETLQLYNFLDLLNGLRCLEMVLFLEKYNKSVVREFYAINTSIDDPDSPNMGQVY